MTTSSYLRHMARRTLKRFWPELYDWPLEKILKKFDLQKTQLTIAKAKESELKRQNAELAELAIQDPLTSLVNRRGLNFKFEAVHSALARTLRHNVKDEQRHRPIIAALLIDIDFFKKINDRHGHQVGDQVLAGVATLMKQHLGHRPEDILCRFGGEEFFVVLPHSDVSHAYIQAALFASVVRQQAHLLSGEAVTLSIGVTMLELDPEMPSETMLERLCYTADTAMYRAKETGRDRVVRFDTIEEH